MFREVKDSGWSANHIAHRGTTLDDVPEAILERPCATRDGRDGTRWFYGQTYTGRYLFVVAAADSDDSRLAFVVTARDMTLNERRHYQRTAR